MTTTELAQSFFHEDWEEYARCYDSLLHLKPYSNLIEMVARESLTYKEGAILDASCGTGNFEKKFLELQGSEKRIVIGIDTSKEMLARAVQKCAELPTVNFLEADLNTTLPFPDESFSQVVSINTLYAVSSPAETLKEFHRVLAQNGRLLLVTPKHGYENGEILKEHCESSFPSSFWEKAHSSSERESFLIREAVKDEQAVNDMLIVAEYNRNIAINSSFHFFEEKNLLSLITISGFSVIQNSRTYANQALFIIATKS